MSDKPQPMDDLKSLMSGTPEATPKAKARAKTLAMEAFAEAHCDATHENQGLLKRLRLIFVNPLSKVNKMQESNRPHRPWIYGGALASICVVALTAVMVRTTQPELITLNESVLAADPIANKADWSEPEIVGLSEKEAMPEMAVEALTDSSVSPAETVQPAPKMQLKKDTVISRLRKPTSDSELYDRTILSAPDSHGGDEFSRIDNNPIVQVLEAPVSTFSVDVDTASYSLVRRQLNSGFLPQKNAVRLEEIVNYFDYQYPLPTKASQPFATHVSVVDSPWNSGNKLVHIGIKGYELETTQWPKTNLVFLLDVSGSMNQSDKLPLVKQSMELLLSRLKPDDTVAIVVYAGAAGTVLPPTPAKERHTILSSLNNLQAGGSTDGGEGIKLAYRLAQTNYQPDAVNRVILATDGDFNVGIQDHDQLTDFIERKRDAGVYLSVLGFGQGNYHDNLMQKLAQNGNGIAAYIDTLSEAQKVLVHQATSALFPIANDVKVQVEFNPGLVAEYRLLGFESRMLERQDFNNDKVDAGDIGAGHSVTAIYEITPVDSGNQVIDERRYGVPQARTSIEGSEYGFIKLRYKLPGAQQSQRIEQPIYTRQYSVGQELQQEINFGIAVAGFAQLLRGGEHTGNWTYDDVITMAQANKGSDAYGYRTEFIQLVRKAKLAKTLP